jgi:type IV pilus assembly protein PilA
MRLARWIAGTPGTVGEQLGQHRSRTAAMLTQLTQSLDSTRGFTLIEVLVVVLIVGILAAIAMPTLLSAQGKANDAAAESLAGSAQTAVEVIASDAAGSYAGVSKAAIKALDPAIATAAKGNEAWISKASGTADTYTVTATSAGTSNTYTVARAATGFVSRTCKVASLANLGGCPRATSTKQSPAFTW